MLAGRSIPVAVVDVLNGLLEAEMNSIFRFLADGSPYLDRAAAGLRRPLQRMAQSSHRQAEELADLIDALGAVPIPRQLVLEEQYLAYLSFKFLLPKLANAERLTIVRYENALRALEGAPAEVKALVQSHLAEHRADVEVLEKAEGKSGKQGPRR